MAVAAQIWTMMHGYVLAEIIGVLGTDGRRCARGYSRRTITNLLVGLGGDRERILQSFQRLKPPAALPPLEPAREGNGPARAPDRALAHSALMPAARNAYGLRMILTAPSFFRKMP